MEEDKINMYVNIRNMRVHIQWIYDDFKSMKLKGCVWVTVKYKKNKLE